MISIAITSFKEPKTIGRAINAFLNQNPSNYELIVSAPDKETLDAAKVYARKNKRIKIIQDAGKGKPAALNKIFKIAKGKIIILSDGDVFVSNNSISEITRPFIDSAVGAVTGKVVSTNSKKNMFGYWAHILTSGFHNLRKIEAKKGKEVACSGYLYAIREGIVKQIPEDILADDAFISMEIINKGYKTKYAEKAEVYVRYPDNLPDWIKQKKRTAGRFYQLNKYFKISKSESLRDEVFAGARTIFEINSPKQLLWFFSLSIMRVYIWFRVFFDFRLWNRSFKKTWQRVESTKS